MERTLAFLRPRHAIFHSLRFKHILLVKTLRFKKYLLGSFKWDFKKFSLEVCVQVLDIKFGKGFIWF